MLLLARKNMIQRFSIFRLLSPGVKKEASGPRECEWVTAKKEMLIWGMLGRKTGGRGVRLSEGGEENPPPQRFWGPGRSELTKTPRLRPEVVSARRGEPERPSCNKSDLAILLGQVRLRLKLESRLAPRCSPPPLLIHLNTNYRAFLLTL